MLKDVIVGLLVWIGILAFGLFLATADTFPMTILLILAILLWFAYILVIVRDYQREKRYPTVRYDTRKPNAPQNVYNQEEDNE